MTTFGFGADHITKDKVLEQAQKRVALLMQLEKAQRCLIQVDGENVEVDATLLRETLAHLKESVKQIFEVMHDMRKALKSIRLPGDDS